MNDSTGPANNEAAEIVALERAALDRWGQGDPSAFLEISAPDVVYFDPFLDRRLDGRDALAAHYEPIRGSVHISRYEMDNAKVQFVGDAAVLTFNFVSYGGTEDILGEGVRRVRLSRMPPADRR